MKIDNDKYYYQIGNGNEFIEISEKIAHEVMLMDKMEKANERRMRYHGAIYSLDRDDGAASLLYQSLCIVQYIGMLNYGNTYIIMNYSTETNMRLQRRKHENYK
mgnify:CR=1 FL=1